MTWQSAIGLVLFAAVVLAVTVGWANHDRRQDPDAGVPVLIDPTIVIAEAAPVVDEPAAAPSAQRLLEVGGWVKLGTRTVHRDCADARRVGNAPAICDQCRPMLYGSATPAHLLRGSPSTCSVCTRIIPATGVHRCDGGGDPTPAERVG